MTRVPEMLTIAALQQGLREQHFSVRELVDAYLGRIEAQDGTIRSFLHVAAAGAQHSADELDRALAAGTSLPALGGVVVAVKDNIAVRGMPATAASRLLDGYVPPYEATVVSRLRRAGAIIIGKTNLDEFAMGASTEQSGFHPTKNPHDPTRVPGGSSGGSAAAVAADFCTVALGSDTGGSIRQPAAFCGVVGVRPTYGSVSRYGLIALASSMDVVGPIARTVEDAELVLAVIAGYDPKDATTLPHHRVPPGAEPLALSGLRIGVPREYERGLSDPDAARGFADAKAALVAAGSKLIAVSLPSTPLAVPAYYVITPAEASSNLARYDGIRFGHAGDHRHGHRGASATLRGEKLGPEPKRRILSGAFTLSAGYADRYYHTAQRVRTLIRQDFAHAFASVDFLLTPATPTPAFPLRSVQDPIAMYRQDVYLAAASLAGLPAMTIPVPDVGSLPVGVQLIGRQGSDGTMLRFAKSFAAQLGAR